MGTVDSKGTPDRCEFYTIGRDDVTGVATMPREQPPIIEHHMKTASLFMERCNALILNLFKILDQHLHLPLGTLAAKHRVNMSSGSQLRMLCFQPQADGDRRTSLVAHSDLGSLTILFNVLGGLQILSDNKKAESEDNWVYVRPAPGCAIMNVGDALAKWTNGLLKSPRHRVTYAPGDQASLVRYSVAYFSRPEHETLMTRLDGSDIIPPLREGEVDDEITAREWHHRNSKAHAARGAGAER